MHRSTDTQTHTCTGYTDTEQVGTHGQLKNKHIHTDTHPLNRHEQKQELSAQAHIFSILLCAIISNCRLFFGAKDKLTFVQRERGKLRRKEVLVFWSAGDSHKVETEINVHTKFIVT